MDIDAIIACMDKEARDTVDVTCKCGNIFEVDKQMRANYKYCPQCASVQVDDKHWIPIDITVKRWNDSTFEIIHDKTPIEDGGFHLGARFTTLDMVAMVEEKVLSVGTLIRHIKTGELYRIDYAMGRIYDLDEAYRKGWRDVPWKDKQIKKS